MLHRLKSRSVRISENTATIKLHCDAPPVTSLARLVPRLTLHGRMSICPCPAAHPVPERTERAGTSKCRHRLGPGFQTCEAIEIELGGQEIRGGWPLRNRRSSKGLNSSSLPCSQTWDASRVPLALGCSKQHLSVLHDLPLDFLIFPSSLLLFSSQKPASASSLALLYAASPAHLPVFHNVPQGVSQRIRNFITSLLKNAPWQKWNWAMLSSSGGAGGEMNGYCQWKCAVK